MPKKPTRQHHPSPRKKPTTDLALLSRSKNPVWSIAKLDREGPWGWSRVICQFFWSDIWPKMRDFESMEWEQIVANGSHEVSVDGICKDAKKQLERLKLDDVERLVSFRFTGKQRLWGIRLGNVFQILWWDPNHEVYPSTLKHT